MHLILPMYLCLPIPNSIINDITNLPQQTICSWKISIMFALQQHHGLSSCGTGKNHHSTRWWWRRIRTNRRKTSARFPVFVLLLFFVGFRFSFFSFNCYGLSHKTWSTTISFSLFQLWHKHKTCCHTFFSPLLNH